MDFKRGRTKRRASHGQLGNLPVWVLDMPTDSTRYTKEKERKTTEVRRRQRRQLSAGLTSRRAKPKYTSWECESRTSEQNTRLSESACSGLQSRLQLNFTIR